MGILSELVYVVKVGNWRYKELQNLSEAEMIVKRMSSVVKGVRVETERRERE
jgi:hypothetical protein